MTKHRDFGSGASTQAPEEITFTLHGEDFTCLPEIQGAVLLDMVGADGENAARSAGAITEFFGKVLEDDSATRFKALVNSKDRFVSIETLGEIVGWIIEEYTNRPEKQPEA